MLLGYHLTESKLEQILVPKFPDNTQEASASETLEQRNTGFGVVLPIERLKWWNTSNTVASMRRADDRENAAILSENGLARSLCGSNSLGVLGFEARLASRPEALSQALELAEAIRLGRRFLGVVRLGCSGGGLRLGMADQIRIGQPLADDGRYHFGEPAVIVVLAPGQRGKACSKSMYNQVEVLAPRRRCPVHVCASGATRNFLDAVRRRCRERIRRRGSRTGGRSPCGDRDRQWPSLS